MRSPKSVATVSARRTATPLPGGDDFTYAVLADVAASPPTVRGAGERRTDVRQRTRLRSGKIVDTGGRLIAECLIANRSSVGGMLRFPGAAALPPSILLYDDQSGDLSPAAVVWRRSREAGIRFIPKDRSERYRALAEALRRRYRVVDR